MSDMSTDRTTNAARLEAMWEAVFGKWDGEEGVTYQGLNGSRRTIMAKLRRMLAALDELDNQP